MKRILVALDGSPRAPQVIATAARLAELADAKLIVYRAVAAPRDVPMELFIGQPAPIEDLLRERAHRELEELASAYRARVEAIAVDIATAWDGICRTANDRDVDLVVVGSHGFGGLDRILGTTAAKVVNRLERNVLVVRTPL